MNIFDNIIVNKNSFSASFIYIYTGVGSGGARGACAPPTFLIGGGGGNGMFVPPTFNPTFLFST